MHTPEQLFETALVSARDHRPEEALRLLTECIKAKPLYAEAWAVRGSVVHAQGDTFGAILHYDRALQYNENLHDIWSSRGVALVTLGMWDAAEASFEKSNELYPNLEAYTGLGGMYLHLMRLQDAEGVFRKALEVSDTPDSRCNLGLSLLGQKRFSEAWPYYYARHERSDFSPRARKLFPQWKGEKGTVILSPEQGFGDEIMAMRYAKIVKFHGNKVILEARPQLARLAKSLNVEVVVQGDPLPRADYSCALMDVPMVMGVEPCPMAGYLHEVSDCPISLPKGFRVGICWESGKRKLVPDSESTRQQKSLPLGALKSLAHPEMVLVNLQKDHNETLDFCDPMPFCNDFADTAAVIDQLDLVITVDTSIAHLAGALGKKVFNLVRYNAYWPWCVDWYESMRIFRQPSLGDWDTPLKEIRKLQ